MNEGEEAREVTFEWKIPVFIQRTDSYKRSPEFKFDTGESFWLITPAVNKSSYFYEFILYIPDISTFRHNRFCKLSLIDSQGKEFHVRKRTEFPIGPNFDGHFPLMAIEHMQLVREANKLLPNGVLTLRLSWGEDDRSVCEPDNGMPSDTNSDKKPIKLLNDLSDDFSRLYESKKNTDCVLKVGDAKFSVHRVVLSARSEVFAAMFHHDTSENRSGEVDIPDVDETVLSYFIQYLYSGHINELSANTAAPMYLVADKYGVIELRRVCCDVLKSSLTIENVCEAALVADIHGETDLEKKVVLFVKSRLEEIEETDQWKKLLQTKPLLAVKLLRSALLA